MASLFADIQKKIEDEYDYSPGGFWIGDVHNGADENQWSGRAVSYAVLNGLTTLQALDLFGEHYRAVLADLNGTSHANIRALMTSGIGSVRFDGGAPLIKRKD